MFGFGSDDPASSPDDGASPVGRTVLNRPCEVLSLVGALILHGLLQALGPRPIGPQAARFRAKPLFGLKRGGAAMLQEVVSTRTVACTPGCL